MKNRFSSAGWTKRLAVTALLGLAAACGPDESMEDMADDMEAPGQMEGMDGRSGGGVQGGMMMSGGMMEEMGGQLEHMAGLPADSLDGMLATHRQMVGNMMAQMTREMREMDMATDAAWEAVVDSIRADMRLMPAMGSEGLHAAMPAHRERVMRLMGMHRDMMGGGPGA